MQYLGYTDTKTLFVVYLKFKFNWASRIFSGHPRPCVFYDSVAVPGDKCLKTPISEPGLRLCLRLPRPPLVAWGHWGPREQWQMHRPGRSCTKSIHTVNLCKEKPAHGGAKQVPPGVSRVE